MNPRRQKKFRLIRKYVSRHPNAYRTDSDGKRFFVMELAKQEAIRIIRNYIRNCPEVYVSFEKMSYYRWALNEALKMVRHSSQSPLEVLEVLLARYDDYAHRKNPSSYVFEPAASAVDDLIDVLLTS